MIVSTNKTPMPFLSEFLTTSFQNVRSKDRTDELHKALLNEILNANPEMAEYRWEFEYKINDAFGGTFQVDIVGFDTNDNIRIVILDKAYQSSVNKNIKNYANTTIGESARLYYASDCNKLDKILFVSVMPRLAPMFTKTGNVKGFDNLVKSKNRTKIQNVLQDQYGDKVNVIDLYYDIENVTEMKNQTDYNTINPINLTPMPVV